MYPYIVKKIWRQEQGSCCLVAQIVEREQKVELDYKALRNALPGYSSSSKTPPLNLLKHPQQLLSVQIHELMGNILHSKLDTLKLMNEHKCFLCYSVRYFITRKKI